MYKYLSNFVKNNTYDFIDTPTVLIFLKYHVRILAPDTIWKTDVGTSAFVLGVKRTERRFVVRRTTPVPPTFSRIFRQESVLRTVDGQNSGGFTVSLRRFFVFIFFFSSKTKNKQKPDPRRTISRGRSGQTKRRNNIFVERCLSSQPPHTHTHTGDEFRKYEPGPWTKPVSDGRVSNRGTM